MPIGRYFNHALLKYDTWENLYQYLLGCPQAWLKELRFQNIGIEIG